MILRYACCIKMRYTEAAGNKERKRIVHRRGFTLIELSIVLVITGLLAGGVLAGRELIEMATIRKQGKQLEEYTIAYQAFRLKYNCLPGDCRNSASFFPGAVNGNGNDRIENNTYGSYDTGAATWTASGEYQYFFITLAQAGLIRGSYAATAVAPVVGQNMPPLILNTAASFFASDAQSFDATHNPSIQPYRRGTNWLWAVACDLTSAQLQDMDDDCGVFMADQLRQLDEKFDDGQPLAGKLLGFGGYNSQNNCLVGTTRYDVSQTSKQCQAAFQID